MTWRRDVRQHCTDAIVDMHRAIGVVLPCFHGDHQNATRIEKALADLDKARAALELARTAVMEKTP